MNDFYFNKVPLIEEIESINLETLSYDDIEELDFVLPGFLAATVGSIVGIGATSKSLAALILNMNVAGIKSVNLGIGEIKTGKSVFISCEDPLVVAKYRSLAIREKCTLEEWKTASKNASIHGFSEHSIDIMNEEWFLLFLNILKGKRLAMFDTLTMVHNFNENDNSEMKKVIGQFKKLAALSGCSILFIHHSNKGAVRSGNADAQQAVRGASCLSDNIRFQINMYIPSADDKDFAKVKGTCKAKDCTTLYTPKVNYGEKYGPYFYQRKSSINKEKNKVGYILKKLGNNKNEEEYA